MIAAGHRVAPRFGHWRVVTSFRRGDFDGILLVVSSLELSVVVVVARTVVTHSLTGGWWRWGMAS